jgi:NitT/TauT family transport system ATP-binding protein
MLALDHVYFIYPNRKRSNGSTPWVLKDFSLEVRAGEFISVIGPSGCGKTTLLSLISGLLRPDRGRILDHGQEVLGPSRRRVLIFQGHLLFPWKTAAQNIEFVLKARGVPRGNRRGQALQYLQQVKLESYADAYPQELSGGMQQRIGIARALAAEPDILLLDEPFSSVDVMAKCAIIDELKMIAERMAKTVILVTHNLEEAFYIGHRIYLMASGPGRIAATFDLPETKPDQLISLGLCGEFQEFKENVSALMNGNLERKVVV